MCCHHRWLFFFFIKFTTWFIYHFLFYMDVKFDLLIFRILERLQAAWLWRSGRSPPNATASLFWKPSWKSSSSSSTNEPVTATSCLSATAAAWRRFEGEQSSLKLIIRPRSGLHADSSRAPRRTERRGVFDGGGGRWRASHSASTCNRRLRDWGMRLPGGCGRGLGARGGKRRRSPDVQGQRWGLLLWASTADRRTERAHVWAAQPHCQHQHQHWRPHGVIQSVPNQQTSDMT